jgi:hypothetical protein
MGGPMPPSARRRPSAAAAGDPMRHFFEDNRRGFNAKRMISFSQCGGEKELARLTLPHKWTLGFLPAG